MWSGRLTRWASEFYETSPVGGGRHRTFRRQPENGGFTHKTIYINGYGKRMVAMRAMKACLARLNPRAGTDYGSGDLVIHIKISLTNFRGQARTRIGRRGAASAVSAGPPKAGHSAGHDRF
jgi:hypothetical protein